MNIPLPLVKKNYKAGALQYTLVIGIIIASVSMLLILLYQYHLSYSKKVQIQKKLYENSQSGVKYIAQSQFTVPYHQKILLFENLQDSVEIWKTRWGIYNLSRCRAYHGKQEVNALAFTASSGFSSQRVLTLSESWSRLSLVGNTHIQGDIYISGSGITTSHIGGEYYTGSFPLVQGNTYSTSTLPQLPEDFTYSLKQIDATKASKEVLYKDLHTPIQENISFQSPTQKIILSSSNVFLNHTSLQGNILLYSQDSITVGADNHYKNIIIQAKKVTLQSGFTGSLQIISPTIVVEDKVHLQYPSALVSITEENIAESYIQVGKEAKIEGSILMLIPPEDSSQKLDTHAYIGENTTIEGEVYVQGNIEFYGNIHGRLYGHKSLVRKKGHIYNHYLYNTRLSIDSLPQNFGGLPLHEKENIVSWVL